MMFGKKKPKSESTDRPYLEPYEKATREMGAGFESQLWISTDAQRKRFEVLTQLGRFKDRVVADLGCGIGDLPIYLHEHAPDQFPKSYIGIEGVDAMADHARARIADAGVKRTSFDVGDFVADDSLADLLVNDASVEVFIFSGSLNTLSMNGAMDVLDEFWHALLAAKSDDCCGTLIFNFLSDRHNAERTPASAPAVRFDPADMLDWALKRTPIVQMRHEYLKGHDATIVMDVG